MGYIAKRRNYTYVILFILLVTMLPVAAKAQELECGDQTDPFNAPCPIDNWVIVLVIIAGFFTAIHLSRKKKSVNTM